MCRVCTGYPWSLRAASAVVQVCIELAAETLSDIFGNVCKWSHTDDTSYSKAGADSLSGTVLPIQKH